MKIVYYSRSGNCERIAKKLSKETGFEIVSIISKVSWNGFFGYMKAGYNSMKGNRTPYELNSKIDDKDIILIAPLWAGNIATPVLSFLDDNKTVEVNLIVVSKGSLLKNEMKVKTRFDIVESKKNEDVIISEILNKVPR